MVDLINDSENSSNKKLLAAVTGALWKVSSDSDNVERLIDLGIVPTLIRLLLENSDALDDLQFNPLKISVLTNVVGALAECAKQQDNRDLIKNEDGLAPLIKLIGRLNLMTDRTMCDFHNFGLKIEFSGTGYQTKKGSIRQTAPQGFSSFFANF